MTATKNQKRANKQNGKKSIGPITEEGKQTSSRNATKHGLYSEDIIVKSPNINENEEDYENLVVSLFNEFRPIGEFQEQLVFKIANCLWRSRRVIRAETAHIINRQCDRGSSISKLYSKINCVPDDYYSKLILRYELRLDRQLSRYYRMLVHNQKLQRDMSIETNKGK